MAKLKENSRSKPDKQPDCIEFPTDRRIVVVEGGVSATFIRPSKGGVRKIRYDGCHCRLRAGRRADFIIGLIGAIDVIVELKGSDTNLKGSDDSSASAQVESTFVDWKGDDLAARRIAALIVYGRIEGAKKGAGRRPRARSTIQSLEAYFLRRFRILLLVRESGEAQLKFTDFA